MTHLTYPGSPGAAQHGAACVLVGTPLPVGRVAVRGVAPPGVTGAAPELRSVPAAGPGRTAARPT
jgi:hypothetical protein